MEMKRYGLPKAYRLRKRRDFLLKRRKSRKVHTEHFTVICGENRTSGPRLGIVVSKKVGKAVQRNKVKRLVREFFRLNRGNMRREDMIVIARPMMRAVKYGDIREELERVL